MNIQNNTIEDNPFSKDNPFFKTIDGVCITLFVRNNPGNFLKGNDRYWIEKDVKDMLHVYRVDEDFKMDDVKEFFDDIHVVYTENIESYLESLINRYFPYSVDFYVDYMVDNTLNITFYIDEVYKNAVYQE
jgi:hypothetical protein